MKLATRALAYFPLTYLFLVDVCYFVMWGYQLIYCPTVVEKRYYSFTVLTFSMHPALVVQAWSGYMGRSRCFKDCCRTNQQAATAQATPPPVLKCLPEKKARKESQWVSQQLYCFIHTVVGHSKLWDTVLFQVIVGFYSGAGDRALSCSNWADHVRWLDEYVRLSYRITWCVWKPVTVNIIKLSDQLWMIDKNSSNCESYFHMHSDRSELCPV